MQRLRYKSSRRKHWIKEKAVTIKETIDKLDFLKNSNYLLSKGETQENEMTRCILKENIYNISN